MHAIAEPCPNCGSIDIQRSRWRFRDCLALLLFLQPVRCLECRERFWTRMFGSRIPAKMNGESGADTVRSRDLVIRIHRPSRIVRALLLALGGTPPSRIE